MHAGSSVTPHECIGRARRLRVQMNAPVVSCKHQVTLEAVQNHYPQVVVVGEVRGD